MTKYCSNCEHCTPFQTLPDRCEGCSESDRRGWEPDQLERLRAIVREYRRRCECANFTLPCKLCERADKEVPR